MYLRREGGKDVVCEEEKELEKKKKKTELERTSLTTTLHNEGVSFNHVWCSFEILCSSFASLP